MMVHKMVPSVTVISELYQMVYLNSLDALNTDMKEFGVPSVMTTSIKTTTLPKLPVDNLISHGPEHIAILTMIIKVMRVNQLGLIMFLVLVVNLASSTAQEMISETWTVVTMKIFLFLVKKASNQQRV